MFVKVPYYFVLSSRQTCFDKHGQCAYWCHLCAFSPCWRIANALLYLVARFGAILMSFRTWEASLFHQDCNFACAAWVSTSTSTALLKASVVLLLVLSFALLNIFFGRPGRCTTVRIVNVPSSQALFFVMKLSSFLCAVIHRRFSSDLKREKLFNFFSLFLKIVVLCK